MDSDSELAYQDIPGEHLVIVLSFLNRLAEKYRECLSNKEKILKEIEVKKEYLSSLQPRLNSIMQVRVSPTPPSHQSFALPSLKNQ